MADKNRHLGFYFLQTPFYDQAEYLLSVLTDATPAAHKTTVIPYGEEYREPTYIPPSS
jgi:hypothetical protein